MLINNVLKKYNEMKEEIKRLNQLIEDFSLFINNVIVLLFKV